MWRDDQARNDRVVEELHGDFAEMELASDERSAMLEDFGATACELTNRLLEASLAVFKVA